MNSSAQPKSSKKPDESDATASGKGVGVHDPSFIDEKSYCGKSSKDESNDKELNEFLLRRFDIWRDYIKHEDNLINNRVTWFVAFQSFLIATYGIIFSNTLRVLAGDHNLTQDGYIAFVLTAYCILLMINIAGLGTAHSTYVSVMAASNAIRQLALDWSRFLALFNNKFGPAGINLNADMLKSRYWLIPGITGGGAETNVKLGFRLAANLPRFMHNLWYFLLLPPLLMFFIRAGGHESIVDLARECISSFLFGIGLKY